MTYANGEFQIYAHAYDFYFAMSQDAPAACKPVGIIRMMALQDQQTPPSAGHVLPVPTPMRQVVQ
jgi:hypothetical protein